MRVPTELANSFGAPFEERIGTFAVEQGLIPDLASLRSPRFLARSIVPHVERLSALFNRLPQDQDPSDAQTGAEPVPRKKRSRAEQVTAHAQGLDPYWKRGSNPLHLRLAYFLYFMPPNLFRTASVWSELGRLGYRWSAGENFRGIEFGAGPASGACGIASGESFARSGLPLKGDWALIEQDKAMLELGSAWARRWFESSEFEAWGIRPFHRKLSIETSLLPRAAPKFNLWLMSFFLNEFRDEPKAVAESLAESWALHLADEGLVILIEPALKYQSRRLLELRKELLPLLDNLGMQILLPCLGHQACGALASAEDWCHEEVSWWRPPYFRAIDQMAGLDRKTLPFSYLVLTRSRRPREEILPALANSSPAQRQRLVSPAHAEGQDLEFFVCGEEGKRRARLRPDRVLRDGPETVERGDVLIGAELRGDSHASRVEKVKKVV